MNVARLLRKLHLWVGLVLAIPLLLTVLTGVLLLFKNDYIRATVPGAGRSPPSLSVAQLASVVEDAERLFGREQLSSLRFADSRIGLHQVRLHDDGAAYIDPSTHQVVRWWSRTSDPVEVLFSFHHTLLAGKVGETVMGSIALITVLLVLSGLWIWIAQIRRLSLKLWPRNAKRPALLTAHRELGVLVTLPLLLTLVSAVVLVFPNVIAPRVVPPHASDGVVSWPRALETARLQFPDAELRQVNWPASPGVAATIRLRQAEEWHPNGRTLVFIDPGTSTLLGVQNAVATTVRARVVYAAYPLHAATLGEPMWWLALAGGTGVFVAMIYSVLAYTGRRRPGSRA